MTNGVGAIMGNVIAGMVITKWFEKPQLIAGQEVLVKNWPGIWMTFAAYSLVVGILFLIFFKYEHQPEVETA